MHAEPSPFAQLTTRRDERIVACVSPAIKWRLRRSADANGRSLSEELNFAVRNHLLGQDQSRDGAGKPAET